MEFKPDVLDKFPGAKNMRRGEIYKVFAKEDTINHEQAGNRYAVIIGNNDGNEHCTVKEFVFLTTQEKTALPTHFITYQALKRSTVLCEHIYSYDDSRFGEKVGKLTAEEIRNLDKCLAISVGIKYLWDAYVSKRNLAPLQEEKPTVEVQKVVEPLFAPDGDKKLEKALAYINEIVKVSKEIKYANEALEKAKSELIHIDYIGNILDDKSVAELTSYVTDKIEENIKSKYGLLDNLIHIKPVKVISESEKKEPEPEIVQADEPVRKRRAFKIEVSREELKELYITKGLSAKEIGDKLGMAESTAYAKLSKSGLIKEKKELAQTTTDMAEE